MKCKIILTVITSIIQISYAQIVPKIEWAKIYDGVGKGNDFVNDMKIDNNYNIYLAGRSEGADGTPDIFIIKYSRLGDSLFTVKYISAPSSWDEVNSISVDSDENIYATGEATFGQSSSYAVLFKYGINGNLVWQKSFNSNLNNYSDGQIVVLDYQTNPIIGYNSFQNGQKANVAKYSISGDSLWTTQIKDDTISYSVYCLLTDTIGNIYVALNQSYNNGGDVAAHKIVILKINQAGVIQWRRSLNDSSPRKLIFDKNSNLVLATQGTGKIVKLNTSGDTIWNYSSSILITDVAIDSKNNILASGYGGGIGFFDYVTIKISSSGVELWREQFNSEENLRDFASCVAIDKGDNIYVSGSSHDMVSQGVCYTLRYSETGQLQWQQKYNATHSIFENAKKIFLDDSNNVFIGGDVSDSTNGANYFLLKIKQNTETGVVTNKRNIPNSYSLVQNYPNPFNPTTIIEFSILKNEHVTLEVFDMLGRKMKELLNNELPIGNYSVTLDLSNYSSGIYFYKIKTNNFSSIKKAILVK